MLDLLLHLFRQRELIGNGCIEEEDVLYAAGGEKLAVEWLGSEVREGNRPTSIRPRY